MSESNQLVDSLAAPNAGLQESSLQQEHHSEGNPMLQFDPGVGLWTLLVFFFLLVILKKFVWGPIVTSLDNRDKFIRSSYDEAAKLREEVAQLSQKQQAALEDAKKEAAALRKSAIEEADKIKAELVKNAYEEKARLLDETQKQIATMQKTALSELKSTVVEIALTATEKLLREKLDEAASKQLIQKYIEEIRS
jgi:F-type H+-transporting ATPase subunit b